jgi:hypothetical protein
MVGLLSELRKVDCLDPHALQAYVGLTTNPARRTIPGLVHGLGRAGFAESVFLPERTSNRACERLAAAGKVIFDWDARAIYALGAVLLDPFVNPPSVKAGARQFFELEPSKVKAAVQAEIEASLQRQKRDPKKETQKLLIEVWREELAELEGRSDGASDTGLDAGSEAVSSDPDPNLRSLIADSAAAAASVPAFQRAWGRLPRTFAAAAADDLIKAIQTWPAEEFGALVVALFESAWVSGDMRIPPTLRRLVSEPAFATRVIAGEFRARSGHRWQCPDCRYPHSPVDACPPKCRACHEPHSPGYQCSRLKELEEREAEEAALKQWRSKDGESWEQLVARVGGREAYRIKAGESTTPAVATPDFRKMRESLGFQRVGH